MKLTWYINHEIYTIKIDSVYLKGEHAYLRSSNFLSLDSNKLKKEEVLSTPKTDKSITVFDTVQERVYQLF